MAKRRRPIDLLNGLSVPVYRMAEQEFCELKVDLELRHPQIEDQLRALPEVAEQLESIDRGKEFHDAVAAPAQPISANDLERFVSSRQPFTLIETSLRGTFDRLPLIGRPDAIHFDGKGNGWVVEHKVRARPYLTSSDDAQLRLYGFLLKQDERFLVHRLALVCVITGRYAAERIMDLPENRRIGLAQMVCKELPELSGPRRRWDTHSVQGLGRTPLRAATFHYDPEKATEELKFLSAYWLGTRQPMPTRKVTKCAACRVNALRLCPEAHVRYGEEIESSKIS